MIRPIMKIEFMLKKKCAPATAADMGVVQDLLDTLEAHADECVGLAANMIGVQKRIIVFTDYGDVEDFSDDLVGENRVMLNPEVIAGEEPYQVAESCLSLKGARAAFRYDKITVRFQDTDMEWHEEDFTKYTAQIIQHEIDHCNGILI